MNDENTFNILLSTDNHLGFLEKDPIRGNDSFVTFEEILSIGERVHPDFVLLGGDIFHENKPSLSSLFKCTELLRKYTLNDREIRFQIVSEQQSNFSHSNHFKFSNFNDSNLNVGMPLFSIHGNHDDPIDKSNLCALDLLHASGLLNLFGKHDSVERVEVAPILLRKGRTKVALYGLGAIRNERLHRLWTQNKVVFVRPAEAADSWFSVLVLHQNRARHGLCNYLPEGLLPGFLDLVVWGHEHDCRLDPEWVASSELYISQPGSSVATSLSDGEAIDKYVGILKIIDREFKIDKVKLETVRPFVCETVVLLDEPSLDVNDLNIEQKLIKFCVSKINDLLIKAEGKRSENVCQPALPLVRLKIDYSGGFSLFSTARLSGQYVGRVANPEDMIVFNRKKECSAREKMSSQHVILGLKESGGGGPESETVEEIVRRYFSKAGDKLKMTLLNERELCVGVKLFVDKDNDEMVTRAVDIQVERTMEALNKRHFTESSIDKEIGKIVDLLKTMCDKDSDEEGQYMMERLLKEVGKEVVRMELDDDDEVVEVVKEQSTRGRGRGRGRGKGKTDYSVDDSSLSSDRSSVASKRSKKT